MSALRSLFLLTAACIVLFSCGEKQDTGMPVAETQRELALPQLNYLNSAIEKDPDNSEYLFRRSKILLDIRNYKSAQTDIEKAIALDPSQGKMYYQSAKVLSGLGKISSAIEAGEKSESLNFTEPGLFLLLSDLYLSKGDLKRSNSYLEKARKTGPFHADLEVMNGKHFLFKGDTTQAVYSFRMALQKEAANTGAMKGLAEVYLARKMADSSMFYIISGKKIEHEDPFFHFCGGKILDMLHLEESGVASYRTALYYDSAYAPAWMELGMRSYNMEKYEEALKYFSSAEEYSEDNVKLYLLQAEILEKTDKEKSAVAYYQKVLERDSSNEKAQQALEKLYIAFPDLRKTEATDQKQEETPEVDEEQELKEKDVENNNTTSGESAPVRKDEVREKPKPKPVKKDSLREGVDIPVKKEQEPVSDTVKKPVVKSHEEVSVPDNTSNQDNSPPEESGKKKKSKKE